jgi:hypothetical protein
MVTKRPIHNASSLNKLKLNMINRFEKMCGVGYTSKLNKMFTSMSFSNNLGTKFRNYLKEKITNSNIYIV